MRRAQSTVPRRINLKRTARAASEALESRLLLSTTAHMVREINRMGALSGGVTEITPSGDLVYFRTTPSLSSSLLWKTDGTRSGTKLLASFGGDSLAAGTLTDVNGTLFFAARGPSSFGTELWKSDGTPAGTVMVKDIFAGSTSSQPLNLVNVQGTLFFSAKTNANGTELWKSDGTAAGTVLVRDITPGASSSLPDSIVAMNGVAYFAAYTNGFNRELWRSDGTESGTWQVRDIAPGTASSIPTELSVTFLASGNTLYFPANDGISGTELWKSDGTEAGTQLVADLAPGAASSLLNQVDTTVPRSLIATTVGSTLYFAATYQPSFSNRLWRTDGTTAGTSEVATTLPSPFNPQRLTDLNGTLLFSAGSALGYELWRSDGTAAGTRLVRDIRPGSSSSILDSSSPREEYKGFVTSGPWAYFAANDGVHGTELWRTDGSTENTTLHSDVLPGPTGGQPTSMRAVAGVVYFDAYDGLNGRQLWRSDARSTVRVTDIAPGLASANPADLTEFNGDLYFSATDGSIGSSLWRTDGTQQGTRRAAPDAVLAPTDLTPSNGMLFFAANSSATGRELWKTDGTPEGTVLVKDITPGTGSSAPGKLIAHAGLVFFMAGETMWRTDGSAAGTLPLTTIEVPSSVAFASAGSTLFFSANDGVHGTELWTSDGTPEGTRMLRDLAPGATSSSPQSMVAVAEALYFWTAAAVSGFTRTLWKSDGTAEGTFEVQSFAGLVGYLSSVGGQLFFPADDGVTGVELWRSDGTPLGTRRIMDIRPGLHSSNPDNLVAFDEAVYFSATDANGHAVWKTDGTEAGTVRVFDADPNDQYSGPDGLTVAGPNLYFTAANATYGIELWQSDGTTAGTTLVTDLYAGKTGSFPSTSQILKAYQGHLYFAATDGRTGNELWTLKPPATPPAVDAATFDVERGPQVSLTFEQAIDPASIDVTGLRLLNLDTGSTSWPTAVRAGQDARSLVLDFDTLADGRYRLRVEAGAVLNVDGVAMTADHTFESSDTFVLAGDADRDRVVNFSDLLTLAQNYGQSLRTHSQGDFDYDGSVNFSDLLILAQQYGRSLPDGAVKAGASATAVRSERSTPMSARTRSKAVDEEDGHDLHLLLP